MKAHAYLRDVTEQLRGDLLDGASILTSYRATYRRFRDQGCDADVDSNLAATLPSCNNDRSSSPSAAWL